MKLFNPWENLQEMEVATTKSKRGRPRKSDKRSEELETHNNNEVFMASIWEALRHNYEFHAHFLSHTDCEFYDIDEEEPPKLPRITELIRAVLEEDDFAISAPGIYSPFLSHTARSTSKYFYEAYSGQENREDVYYLRPWNELPDDFKTDWVKELGKGSIETKFTYLDYFRDEQHGPVAKILLRMLDDGRIDLVKAYLCEHEDRIIALPDFAPKNAKDRAKVAKEVSNYIRDFKNVHGNKKLYPSKVDWQRFLSFKTHLMNRFCFCEAYVRVMIADMDKEVRNRFWDECHAKLELLPNDRKKNLLPLIGLDRSSVKWGKLQTKVKELLEDTKPQHALPMSIKTVTDFSQKYFPPSQSSPLDFLLLWHKN